MAELSLKNPCSKVILLMKKVCVLAEDEEREEKINEIIFYKKVKSKK